MTLLLRHSALALLVVTCTSACTSSGVSADAIAENLSNDVLLYSSFDGSADADFAVGDASIYTRSRGAGASGSPAVAGLQDEAVRIAPGAGVHGDALEFTAKDRQLIYYKAEGNIGYDANDWSGAISFWLQLDPATDLEPGYCDPIQITDTRYNDASIWVDFTKVTPRKFRLGVIGDLAAWNPDGVEGNDNPEFVRRLIPMDTPPFQRGTWTHVAINFSRLNAEGSAELFVDGESIGSLPILDPFTWEEENARIMLGLSYIGLMDELAIFGRPLTEEEVAALSSGAELQRL
ncbi:MAG: LamG-like jellyroll fold domain-containing protein [Planctomycetota bacterium]